MVPYCRKLLAAILLLWAAATIPSLAAGYNRLSNSGDAVAGFDVMSYWQTGEPKPGTRAFSTEWQGAVWLFTSAGNLAQFKSNPERFAPSSGGYCAYAMSQGIKADIHPYIFHIAAGRLYLFYSFESRDKFLADPGLRQQAEDHWAVTGQQIF